MNTPTQAQIVEMNRLSAQDNDWVRDARFAEQRAEEFQTACRSRPQYISDTEKEEILADIERENVTAIN